MPIDKLKQEHEYRMEEIKYKFECDKKIEEIKFDYQKQLQRIKSADIQRNRLIR